MKYDFNDPLIKLGALVRPSEPVKPPEPAVKWVNDSMVTDGDKTYLDDDEHFSILLLGLFGPNEHGQQ